MYCNDIGPADVVFGSHTFSPSFEGVTLKIEETSVPVTNSHQGETPVDQVTTGVKISAEMAVAHATMTDLNQIFDSGSIVSTTKFKILQTVGLAKSAGADTLIIKPLVAGVGTTDQKKWTTIPRMIPKPAVELPFSKDGQRVFLVTFEALAPTTPTAAIAEFGDET